MFKAKEIEAVTGGKIIDPKKARSYKGVSTDTRTINPGELFIPLRGPNFDGRTFIPQALKKGAAALDVADGLKALQDLAAVHRPKFNFPIIGITGSVGKTTTKDMLASILSQRYKTLKNEENFNNEIGVPLTLLKLNQQHQAAVIEMGMQGLGEIGLLAQITRPTVTVVTNIGEAHLEFLKTKKNVARAKAEIFRYLTSQDYAVINQDDEFFEHLRSIAKEHAAKIVTFGLLEKADITTADLAGINLPVPGEHNIYNALAALAVAKVLHLNKKQIKTGLEKFHPSSKRMEVINRADGVKIINDTYNANPQSMAAALKVLAGTPAQRRIAVLGDMYELGAKTTSAHRKIGCLARKLGIDLLFSVGEFSKTMTADHHFPQKKLVLNKLKTILAPGDVLLFKASRGMHLEDLVEALRKI
jgi:UDP-N-acetylmuramoyl-tripeptide--D-alanyl-D-alanine ligase